ncbi:SDR family NAD(P)-dependent oxidoreductase [Streptomyces viridochromogenes]|uniref:SDR family NAD(P)-dependent oxidoreductase n=1 Tax=Streptomyces viridochromogenes TaxID=1938 RepID=UPI00069F4F15|nr:SDR family NAD(P)-dependent oxidoreductase [Streptomyces viridochromogenes]
MTEMALQGRVAVVTGAETGTGAAVAAELAGQGAAVAVQYLASFARGKAVVRGIEEAGGAAIAVRADPLDRGQTELLHLKAGGAFGDVDLVVATDAVPTPVDPEDAEALADAVRARLLGVLGPLQAAVPAMTERGGGLLVYVPDEAGPDAFVHALARPVIEAAVTELGRRHAAHGIVCRVVPADAGEPPAAVAGLLAAIA